MKTKEYRSEGVCSTGADLKGYNEACPCWLKLVLMGFLRGANGDRQGRVIRKNGIKGGEGRMSNREKEFN